MPPNTNQNPYGYIDYFNKLSSVPIPQSTGIQSPQVQAPQINTVGKPTLGSYNNVSTGNTNPELIEAQIGLLKSQQESLDMRNAAEKKWNESWGGQISPYVKMGTGIINAGASLASIYTGLEQLKLAKKAENRADEMWREQLAELNHVRGVRKRINAAYGGK